MTNLVYDAHGNPTVEPEPMLDFCPKCGADSSKHEEVESFGGYRKTVCKKCGTVLASGRDGA